MTAPNPYEPDADQQAANEAAVREAVEHVARSYLGRRNGRPMNRRQRELEERAARLARYWTNQDRKRA